MDAEKARQIRLRIFAENRELFVSVAPSASVLRLHLSLDRYTAWR